MCEPSKMMMMPHNYQAHLPLTTARYVCIHRALTIVCAYAYVYGLLCESV